MSSPRAMSSTPSAPFARLPLVISRPASGAGLAGRKADHGEGRRRTDPEGEHGQRDLTRAKTPSCQKGRRAEGWPAHGLQTAPRRRPTPNWPKTPREGIPLIRPFAQCLTGPPAVASRI